MAGFFVSALCVATAVSAEDLGKLTLMQLCAKVRKGNDAALQELVSRRVYPVSEIAHIARGEIFVGMTEGSALCSLGPAATVNQTHTAAGVSLQAVFAEGRRIRYLYIDNGKVTAWQE